MPQPEAPGGRQGCCPALQHRVNKAVLVTHTLSHEQGLQTPTPAQGNNRAQRRSQCWLAVRVTTSWSASSPSERAGTGRGAQPYGSMPAIGHVTPSLGSLLSRAVISQERPG